MRNWLRGRRKAPCPKSVAQLEVMLAAMAPAHDYGAHNVTTSGGNITTVPNGGSAGGQLTVVASTVAAPTADSALLGQLSIGLSNRTLQSSLAAASFAFLHNGTGCHVFCAWVPTVAASRAVWATRSFAGVELGSGMFYQSVQSVNMQTSNGTANLFAHASAAASVPINVGSLVEHSYLESRSPSEAVTTRGSAGIAINAGNSAQAPSASNPTSTLRIGNSSGDTLASDMRWARWIAFNRVLSDGEQATVRQLFNKRYGL